MMLIDARSLPADAELGANVVIIGAGIAGIVLALELERRGIASLLIEAGDTRFSSRGQDLYAAETAGVNVDLRASRTRQLGGSSNCWWGWCSPLNPVDFRHRHWVPNSGWPITAAELAPFYMSAAHWLGITPFAEPDAAAFASPIAELSLQSADLRPWLSHLSAPLRFGSAYRQDLARSSKVRVLLNGSVAEILTGTHTHRATAVVLHTAGERRTIPAKLCVLAAGGVENPRLMLLSRSGEAHGIGNAHDNVGRYFMDHPRLRTGKVFLKDPRSVRRLLDLRFYHGNRALAAERHCASLGLSEAIQEREGLLQCHSGLVASYAGEESDGFNAARQIYRSLHQRRLPKGLPALAQRSMSGLPALAAAYAGHRSRASSLLRFFRIQSTIEPVPDRANRVALLDEADALGMQRVHVTWRVGDAERRTHLAALDAFARAVDERGLGHVELDEVKEADWSEQVMTTSHHIGTTRMSVTPRDGVVDRNCRVHGYANLFVAGSSVFPTASSQPPTFTIVALTLRLASEIATHLSHASYDVRAGGRSSAPAPAGAPTATP